MSKAFKCDRCKKCFDPYALKGDEYFTTIKEFFCQTGVEFSNNEFGYREEGAHLCPDCSVAFLRFCDCRDEKTGKETKSDDRVNHPNHYTFGDIEVIDYIRDKLTPEEFQGYCEGNVLKYVSRWRHKGGVEDLRKAEVYLKWMIESAMKELSETSYKEKLLKNPT